eukprot:gene2070-5129_t
MDGGGGSNNNSAISHGGRGESPMQGSANLESVLDQWKKVGVVDDSVELENLKKDLDEDVLAMEQRRKEREECRNRLKTETQAFKKNIDELQAVVKMCKQAEKSFLSIYQRIIVATDPLQFLVRVKELEDQVSRLQTQKDDAQFQLENRDKMLEEYRSRLSVTQEQDATIHRLQEQLAFLERNVDNRVEVKLREHLRRVEQDSIAKEEHYEAERTRLLQRVLEAEVTAQASASSAKENVSAALEARRQFDEEVEALSRAAELANNQLDIANGRIQELETELSLCKQQLQDALEHEHAATNALSTSASASLINSDLEGEMMAKDREIARLLASLHSLQAQMGALKSDSNSRIAAAEDELESTRNQIIDLRSELNHKKDYEDVKKELSVLRQIEFGDSIDAQAQPLEVLLKQKVVRLESENTHLRNEFQSLQAAFDDFKKESVSTSSLVKKQQDLINNLEGHLACVNSKNQYNTTNMTEESSLLSLKANIPAESLSYSTNSVNTDMLLSIVTSQRDRFRSRILELESELSAVKQEKQKLQNQADEFRADNIKLYEKIRYLNSYADSSGRKPKPSSTSESQDDTLSKYSHTDTTRQTLAETCHRFFAAHQFGQGTGINPAHGVHFDSKDLHDSSN